LLGGKIIKTIKGKIKISSYNSQQCLQTSCQKCIGDITSHVWVAFRDISDLFTWSGSLIFCLIIDKSVVEQGTNQIVHFSFSKNRYFTGNDKNSGKKTSLPF
jgi:hypothetical protein